YWNVNAGPGGREVRAGRDVASECVNNPAFAGLLGDLRDRDVLDAGCGEGHDSRLLARAGARMTGVDISERMIALAVDEERRAPLGITYVCTAYTRLEMFPSASFDAAVSFMSMMDGPGFDRAMAEAFRVLRPGGMLAFSITHPCFITRDAKWMRDEHGTKVAWMVRNYFNPAPWVERWRFTDASADAPEFAVPRFDRTLSEYLNAVLDAGFRLNASSQSIPNAAKARRLASRWRPSASMSVSSRSKKTPFNIAPSPAADINGPRTVADSTTSACGSCRRRRPRISCRSFIRRY